MGRDHEVAINVRVCIGANGLPVTAMTSDGSPDQGQLAVLLGGLLSSVPNLVEVACRGTGSRGIRAAVGRPPAGAGGAAGRVNRRGSGGGTDNG